jgi:leucyl/phenylalanyl-tRNA---protein transferase
MLPYLENDSPFPDCKLALDDPNGLLAAGGDLSPKRLLSAYKNGIFPWYSIDEPILWWSPDPRTVFFIEKFKVNKSAIKTLKKLKLTVTINLAFADVVDGCAEPRKSIDDETWIIDEMKQAYQALHLQGYAHSVEVWQNQQLVGGIYGVAVGQVFCGESMFSRVSNASKIALSCLIKYLQKHKFTLIDCQVENPHLEQLGAINISRAQYLEILSKGLIENKAASNDAEASDQIWQGRELNALGLMINKDD